MLSKTKGYDIYNEGDNRGTNVYKGRSQWSGFPEKIIFEFQATKFIEINGIFLCLELEKFGRRFFFVYFCFIVLFCVFVLLCCAAVDQTQSLVCI